MRYAARRDSNEPVVVCLARALGWKLWKLHTPADWLGLLGGAWRPVEVKTLTGKATKAQVKFVREAGIAGGEVLVWRTDDDVIADTRRIRGW